MLETFRSSSSLNDLCSGVPLPTYHPTHCFVMQVLPKRLEIDIPPSVTSVAEAAVGRDTIMRAVASAVLQADAVEQVWGSVMGREVGDGPRRVSPFKWTKYVY